MAAFAERLAARELVALVGDYILDTIRGVYGRDHLPMNR
jgi:hypothetical protein